MNRLAGIIALVTITGTGVMDAQVSEQDKLLWLGRTNIASATENFPRFTCAEFLERTVYAPVSILNTEHATESAWAFLESFRTGHLAWRDTSSVEVAFFKGAENFAWPGQREYQFSDLDEMIGGTSTTGQFGPFIISVFLSDTETESLQFSRFDSSSGIRLAEYSFRIPAERSHYLVKTGADISVPTAYNGSFWIDAQTGLLKRLNVQVRDAPEQTGVMAASLLIDYDWAQVGGRLGVIPSSSELRLLSSSGTVSIVNARFGACKAFTAESTVRLDDGSAVQKSQTVEPIPAGLILSSALLTSLDSDVATAGSGVRLRLIEDLKDDTGRVLAPKGAIVVGTLVRVEHRFQPSRVITFAIRFDHVEVNAVQIPMSLAALNSVADYGDFRANPKPSPPPVIESPAHREHIATISIYGNAHARIRPGTAMRWQTR